MTRGHHSHLGRYLLVGALLHHPRHAPHVQRPTSVLGWLWAAVLIASITPALLAMFAFAAACAWVALRLFGDATGIAPL
jgi:hypothetical protein